MIYERKYETSPEQFDQYGRLKPSAILYFAQEAAGDHAQQLGTGWETLQEKGLFWAVIRTKAEVLLQPRQGETVTVRTWPMPTTRTAYPRSVTGFDSEGRTLFKVMSLWVLMDVQSRAMVLPGKSGVTVEGITVGGELESPRALPVREPDSVQTRTVGTEHLDRNGHMNNTRYMDWVMELSDAQKCVKGFELCYFNEGRLGDMMELGCSQRENILSVDIHREKTDVPGKKDRIFAASVEF